MRTCSARHADDGGADPQPAPGAGDRRASLVPIDDKQYVYVVSSDMKAERREVVIGARQPGFVEIKSGLKQGDQVVVDGTVRVRPGATVRIGGPEGDRSASADGAAAGRLAHAHDALGHHDQAAGPGDRAELAHRGLRRARLQSLAAARAAGHRPADRLDRDDYPGASASVVETQVTQHIEDSIAGIDGIDTITSTSRDGRSPITIDFRLSRDIEAATNDVRNAVRASSASCRTRSSRLRCARPKPTPRRSCSST